MALNPRKHRHLRIVRLRRAQGLAGREITDFGAARVRQCRAGGPKRLTGRVEVARRIALSLVRSQQSGTGTGGAQSDQ